MKVINTHVSKADLHGHTVNSDGELTVLEIIEEAKKNGLDYYAITDHDCLVGADEAFELSKNNDLGINIIYGVELSTYSLDESVHILGYFKTKLGECNLRDELKKQIESRQKRASKMFDLIKEYIGVEIDKSIIYEINSITRGTMADLILQKTDKYSKVQLFDKFLGDDCPCYIPSTKLPTKTGIDLIHEAGGIAVLAHPCLLKKNNPIDIIKLGVDGVEAIYPRTYNSETKYRDLAKKYNLVVTAGSDFHHFNDSTHGNVGYCHIKGRDVDKFLERLNK